MEATKYIPRENFNLWYELFKQSKGWFLCEPLEGREDVRVVYAFDDMNSFNELNSEYLRLTTPIVETKRCWWKKLKIKLGFNC